LYEAKQQAPGNIFYQSHVPAAVPAETKCLNLIDLNPPIFFLKKRISQKMSQHGKHYFVLNCKATGEIFFYRASAFEIY
jgi:hypothetical protein